MYFLKFNTTVLLGLFYSPSLINTYVNGPDFQSSVNSLIQKSYNIRSQYLSK